MGEKRRERGCTAIGTGAHNHQNRNRVPSQGMVVHGVSCQRPLADPFQEVEWRTGRRGMGVRSLLSANRRWGKRISSVVVFFRDEVELLSGGRETPRLKMWGRWQ